MEAFATAPGSGSGSGSSSMMGKCEEAELSKAVPSRYESQKRRDWNTFGQYLKNQRPPLPLSRCSSAHVLEFLRYLDQFGKTKVHVPLCPFFGNPQPPAPCACPLRQAWGSLDALIGRLRAAFEEHGGKPESNPFGTRPVRLFLREVREIQAKARGIAYQKKKRKRPPPAQAQAQPEPQLQPEPQAEPPPTPMRHHIEDDEEEYSNDLLSLPHHHHYQHQHFATSIPSPSIPPGLSFHQSFNILHSIYLR